MAWPEFYFARHGETAWNRERRYQGARDIPLNKLGQTQADANGVLLKDLLAREKRSPSEFQWFASPLSRAAETMERMRAAFEGQTLPEVQFDDRLKEITFGVLEGRLHAELPEDLAVAPGKRKADYWFHRPEEGENYQDVSKRLEDFSSTLVGPSIIVSHGGIMRVLRHVVEGVDREEAVNYFPPQGAIAHFNAGSMNLYRTALSSV